MTTESTPDTILFKAFTIITRATELPSTAPMYTLFMLLHSSPAPREDEESAQSSEFRGIAQQQQHQQNNDNNQVLTTRPTNFVFSWKLPASSVSIGTNFSALSGSLFATVTALTTAILIEIALALL